MARHTVEQHAIDRLRASILFAGSAAIGPNGSTPQMHVPQELEVRQAIAEAEQFFGSENPVLYFWLGTALQHYTAQFVRGDARKPYLERAVTALKRADTCAAHLPERDDSAPLDRLRIRNTLGTLLVDEALVRDLDSAIACLAIVYRLVALWRLQRRRTVPSPRQPRKQTLLGKRHEHFKSWSVLVWPQTMIGRYWRSSKSCQ